MSILRAALADEWDGLERISRDIRPADWVTMANAVTGLVAIIFAARGETDTAALLVLAGILLDGLDGAVARLGGGGGPLGGFLDSLADLVTFAVAPAVLLVLGVDGALGLRIAFAALLLVAVMLRLARFEVLREKTAKGYFSGLSSPGAALVVVSALLVDLSQGTVLGLTALAAVLMVTRIRYPKLRGWLGVVAVLLILVVLATGVWLDAWNDAATWSMLAFMLVYVLAGPFYVLARIGPTPAPSS